jgi:isoleucyl-tRNA synthetase
MAIAIDPEATYVKVRQKSSGEIFCLLEARLGAYGFDDEEHYETLEKFPGKNLEGVAYEPFFPEWVAEGGPNAFHIYGGTFVLHDTGTGAVHMSPAFGEDDFNLAKKKNLPILDHLDASGRYREGNWSPLVGLDFKAGDKLVMASLKERGLIFRHDTFVHSYPHCYRSGTPLIYRAMGSWFVKVEEFRSLLLEVNDKIHWVPDHVKSGRFGKWLEGARDWNIGRSRYWGNPVPIWQNLETGERMCMGSVADLQPYSDEPITDLHMEFIDHIKIPSQKHPGTFLTRVPFVLDCWFESGSMPYAQKHYPFENKEAFEASFPADFICEGLDQTRGWFYTLTLISALLYKKEAFKNVIVNGLILAEDGRKMSKSLKNYPDPIATLDEFGADSVRLFLLGSPATNGEEARFSGEGVKESTRRLLLPLWNAYNFFATYASVTTWDAEKDFVKSTHQWDCWIECRLQELLQSVEENMNNYEVARVVPLIAKFFDDLNNWYIRRNRRRFWDESHEAFSTLYTVLHDVVKILAPFAPFATEYFFQKLRLDPHAQDAESVHLCSYPISRVLTEAEKTLLHDIDLVQQVVELGRTVRVNHKLKNRQPLASLTIGVLNEQWLVPLRAFSHTILDELNVKSVHFTDRLQALAAIFVKPNFKTLGKRLGDKIKDVQKSLATLDEASALVALNGGSLQVCGEELSPEDLTVELRSQSQSHLVAARSGLVVALEGTLTDALRNEGQARELVSFIQKARKEINFDVEQRIQAVLDIREPGLKEAIVENLAYIQDETLSQISFGPLPAGAQVFEALEGGVIFSLCVSSV